MPQALPITHQWSPQGPALIFFAAMVPLAATFRLLRALPRAFWLALLLWLV